MQRQEPTTASDVYSFGVILWELVARKQFFSEISFMTVLESKVIAGERPEIPHSCPQAYRKLIQVCWANNPTKRPSFSEIVTTLEDIIRDPDLGLERKITLCTDKTKTQVPRSFIKSVSHALTMEMVDELKSEAYMDSAAAASSPYASSSSSMSSVTVKQPSELNTPNALQKPLARSYSPSSEDGAASIETSTCDSSVCDNYEDITADDVDQSGTPMIDIAEIEAEMQLPAQPLDEPQGGDAAAAAAAGKADSAADRQQKILNGFKSFSLDEYEVPPQFDDMDDTFYEGIDSFHTHNPPKLPTKQPQFKVLPQQLQYPKQQQSQQQPPSVAAGPQPPNVLAPPPPQSTLLEQGHQQVAVAAVPGSEQYKLPSPVMPRSRVSEKRSPSPQQPQSQAPLQPVPDPSQSHVVVPQPVNPCQPTVPAPHTSEQQQPAIPPFAATSQQVPLTHEQVAELKTPDMPAPSPPEDPAASASRSLNTSAPRPPQEQPPNARGPVATSTNLVSPNPYVPSVKRQLRKVQHNFTTTKSDGSDDDDDDYYYHKTEKPSAPALAAVPKSKSPVSMNPAAPPPKAKAAPPPNVLVKKSAPASSSPLPVKKTPSGRVPPQQFQKLPPPPTHSSPTQATTTSATTTATTSLSSPVTAQLPAPQPVQQQQQQQPQAKAVPPAHLMAQGGKSMVNGKRPAGSAPQPPSGAYAKRPVGVAPPPPGSVSSVGAAHSKAIKVSLKIQMAHGKQGPRPAPNAAPNGPAPQPLRAAVGSPPSSSSSAGMNKLRASASTPIAPGQKRMPPGPSYQQLPPPPTSSSSSSSQGVRVQVSCSANPSMPFPVNCVMGISDEVVWVGRSDGHISIVDIRTNEISKSFEAHDGNGGVLCMVKAGKKEVLTAGHGAVKKWSLAGDLLSTTPTGTAGDVTSFAFAGVTLCGGTDQGMICVWNMNTADFYVVDIGFKGQKVAALSIFGKSLIAAVGSFLVFLNPSAQDGGRLAINKIIKTPHETGVHAIVPFSPLCFVTIDAAFSTAIRWNSPDTKTVMYTAAPQEDMAKGGGGSVCAVGVNRLLVVYARKTFYFLEVLSGRVAGTYPNCSGDDVSSSLVILSHYPNSPTAKFMVAPKNGVHIGVWDMNIVGM